MKIGMIGYGNMGSAIGSSLVKKGYSLIVTDRNRKTKENVKKIENILWKDTNTEVVEESDVVFLGVKPHILPNVLEEIKEVVEKKKDIWLISMAAGVPLQEIQHLSNHKNIIRMMPNTPALVGESMTAITFPKDVDVLKEPFFPLFEAFGKVTELEEKWMDAFTGACGCLPAYLCLFLEAVADGAVLTGLPRKEAYQWISQTILGTATLFLETNEHPGVLKDKVTSPGGSTIEGVKELERGNFRYLLMNAVEKSVWKNKELGKNKQEVSSSYKKETKEI